MGISALRKQKTIAEQIEEYKSSHLNQDQPEEEEMKASGYPLRDEEEAENEIQFIDVQSK